MTNTKAKNPLLAKKAAGEAAAALVQEGMRVGLGTGSTAAFFIDSLALRCQKGLTITAVATSRDSHQRALAAGIPLIDGSQLESLDLTVDGADEIDPYKRMIKGGGGALLYEKIAANCSKELVIIVDESKLVKHLGKMALPVEIVPFGYRSVLHKIQQLGYQAQLRKGSSNDPFISDAGHYIADIYFKELLRNPEEVHHQLLAIPGVVETGFFFNLAGRVIVGYDDGRVQQFQHF